MRQPPRHRAARRLGIALAASLVVLGCSKSQPLEPLPPLAVGNVAPDFTLADVNPNSASAGKNLSPRGQLGSVSAWYFGHAT